MDLMGSRARQLLSLLTTSYSFAVNRIFWAWPSRLWSNWRSVLAIVQVRNVIQWHRQGFQLAWQWKSRLRCHLRRLLPQAGGGHGHRRGPHGAPSPLTESVLRESHRLDTPGLSGSWDRAQRGPSASHPDRVFRELPPLPASSLPGSQLAGTTLRRTTVRG
jgi:hypothetical protein